MDAGQKQLPDIDGSSADRPSRCMVLCCGMKGVEHIPVRQHDLSKESAVVCHSSNVDGMRFWIPWEEIIRSPHHSRLLRTAHLALPVQGFSVVAHTGDASIVREIPGNRGIKRLVILPCELNTPTETCAECLQDALHIDFHTIHPGRCQVAMELIVESVNILRVHQPQPLQCQDIGLHVGTILSNPR
ncbi:hypothetical protein CKAN_00405200 [Cinnamomum micranthum f. kanehirae]|uniref:Uncharacterized protein n=1 Tax=Cinnamomum micranthum f. kanehirae TaxID=337451 RepID=A0A443NAW4_9MAGN|nr:hypothetical protein CKAN_00405200 [Cinnamomum micranthum f. kanehirae]